jgi:peptide deformylase
MALRPILTVPDPILKQVSKPVSEVTDAHRALMDDMLETMYAAPGIGLAAIQIGVPERIIVMDLAGKGRGAIRAQASAAGRRNRFSPRPTTYVSAPRPQLGETG